MRNHATQESLKLDSETWADAVEFKAAVREWAEKIGVSPTRIQIQEMTRKWASCSPAGVLTFSRAILTERRSFGEAVIVHELIHLKVPNHGSLFKSLYQAYLPGSDFRAQLKGCGDER